MFYKQFLELTDVLNEKFVHDYDFWLATLPDNYNITISQIASQFSVHLSMAEIIADFSFKRGILRKEYAVICPNDECNLPLIIGEVGIVSKYLDKVHYCHNCEEENLITSEDIFVIFKRSIKPNVSDEEIKEAILKRLGIDNSSIVEHENFINADSLGNNLKELYNFCYNIEGSAINNLKLLRKALDNDYGHNTTAKGEAYEDLAVELFNCVKFMAGTRRIHTFTNQFDCTISSPITTPYISIFQKMTPYFIAECKNEKDTPSNTYFHKLSDIMATNEAQVGIVFSRKAPSWEDMQIAREQYLLNRNLPKQRFMVSISDDDLDAILDKQVNLLSYLDFKILEMTTNAKNATYEMFIKSSS